MIAARMNGVALNSSSIAADDRGLNYGDGLFETMLLSKGSVRFFDAHLQRLRTSCDRLRINYPGNQLLESEVEAIAANHHEGVIKIVLTRGVGGRGYRPNVEARPTCIVTLHPMPTINREIRARWCETRLSRNPALAGMKHLNRLEQVLAACEWSDATIDEGLMLDLEGEVVCGTSSNVFIVRNAEIVTPDLRFCGVRGVMRSQVLRTAQALGIPTREEPLYPHDFETASEVFVTNAVRGPRAVVELGDYRWSPGPVMEALCKALDDYA